MVNSNTKSTTVKAGQPAVPFQQMRNAAAGRGLAASRGVPAETRSPSQATRPPVSDRLGTTLTFLLSLALVAGGSLVVAQIWANQAMIR